MNMLSLFPAIPVLMMLGLWLSKSARQIRAVMVAGSSLLLALAVVLVFRYLGLREAGEQAAMLFTESHVWYAPLNIHYAVGVDGISVAMLLLSAIIVVLIPSIVVCCIMTDKLTAGITAGAVKG